MTKGKKGVPWPGILLLIAAGIAISLFVYFLKGYFDVLSLVEVEQEDPWAALWWAFLGPIVASSLASTYFVKWLAYLIVGIVLLVLAILAIKKHWLHWMWKVIAIGSLIFVSFWWLF